GVLHRGEQLRLAFEPREALRIARQALGQRLDRHRAAEAGVARPIDFPHAAAAERGKDLVIAEARAGGQGHGGGDYTPFLAPAGAAYSSSTSSSVFGQSALSSRDSARSASSRPPVWQRAQ